MSQGVEPRAPEASTLPLFSRILLVTDFSSCSEAAVPFARLLAELYGATLFVAHVIRTEPGTEAAAPQAPGEGRDTRELAEEHMRKFLADNPLGEVRGETIIAEGPLADALTCVIQDKQIDLVVVGTHGRSGVGKLVLGSVAQSIFNIVPCPILTVSPRARDSWSAGGKLSRILYATNFSPSSLNALPYALSLAKVSSAELFLLQVIPNEPLDYQVTEEYHKRLNALIPPEARSWCKSDTLVIVGDPAEVILKTGAQQNADFLIIGAHRIEGPFYTINVPLTTAYKVVAHAHCPVLRVRS